MNNDVKALKPLAYQDVSFANREDVKVVRELLDTVMALGMRIKLLEEENRIMREALEFYAENLPPEDCIHLEFEPETGKEMPPGTLAREALAKISRTRREKE